MSSILDAYGSVVGGISNANAASYQAKVAKNNEQIAKQNAEYAGEAGAAQTEQSGLKAKGQQGILRASLAANGIDVNSGSAVDVQESQREIGALDTATVANNAALEAYGYKTQATNYEAQSRMYRAEEQPAMWGGILGAAGSLLSGSPSTPSNFSWMDQSGGGASAGDIFGSSAGGGMAEGGAASTAEEAASFG